MEVMRKNWRGSTGGRGGVTGVDFSGGAGGGGGGGAPPRETPAMRGIDRVLAECLSLEREGKGQLTLAATLQGFPETAHGGGGLAAFDLIAARAIHAAGAARTGAAQIQRTIPLQTSLPLTVDRKSTRLNSSH